MYNLFFLICFNWKIIALQYCVGFCHISIGISHRYIYVPSLLNRPPTPLGCHRVPGVSSLHHTGNSHWLSILHMEMYMFPCYSLNLSHSFLSPLKETTSFFSTSASLFLPCKQVLQYHFSRFHVYALLYNICFSLSDLLHSV